MNRCEVSESENDSHIQCRLHPRTEAISSLMRTYIHIHFICQRQTYDIASNAVSYKDHSHQTV